MYFRLGWVLLSLLLLVACTSPHMMEELEQGKLSFISGNFKTAYCQLLPIANYGNPEAQYAVGYMNYYGYGVERNPRLGIDWMNRAAKQGYGEACHALKLISENHLKQDEQSCQSHFTVQLYGNYEREAVEHFKSQLHLNNLAISRGEHNGREWYVLTYGDYASATQAASAIHALPHRVRTLNPFVRSVDGLQIA